MAIEEIPVGKFGYVQRRTIDWMLTHRLIMGALAICLFTLVFGAGQFFGVFGRDERADFVAAELTYKKWTGSKESLAKLEKLIKVHPELHAKYDGAIAQKLLSSSESGLAASYASSALQRTGGFSPYFESFAKTSLLIGEGKLIEALASAKMLKHDLDIDEHFWETKSDVIRHGALLYGYNLVRIATLEKVAGTAEGELLAWSDLKKAAGWDSETPDPRVYDSEAYLLLQENFKKQSISLLDYIHYREHLLISQK